MSFKSVAIQGAAGAYSHLALTQFAPDETPIFCKSFSDALLSVEHGKADAALLPIENSAGGRVAELHLLLAETPLYMQAEFFLPVRHCLLALNGSDAKDIQQVYSHPQALLQCRGYLHSNGYAAHEYFDTAAAAEYVATQQNNHIAALASSLAAKVYGLQILAENVQDTNDNTTRFALFAKELTEPNNAPQQLVSFLFEVKNIPAALYKALGVFATNGINIVKLESYAGNDFSSAKFYAEALVKTGDPAFEQAWSELQNYAKATDIIGKFAPSSSRGLTC